MLRAARQGNESRLCWQDRAKNDAYKTASKRKGIFKYKCRNTSTFYSVYLLDSTMLQIL